MTALSVAVIGGGIGGTAAALSLLQCGLDVPVYEQARELCEVGAGIQVSPNASRVLHRLGLAETLARPGRQAVGIPSTPLAGWSDPAAYSACAGDGGCVRVAPLPDASRRRSKSTRRCTAF